MANALLQIPFRTTLFDPTDNTILVGGKMRFFEPDQATEKAVYQDPERTITYTQPITLDSAGTTPLIYMDTDTDYFITVKDSSDVSELYAFPYAQHTSGGGSSEGEIYNFIGNGQFTYPANFSKPEDNPQGLITENITPICLAWEFIVNKPDDSTHIVTFENLEAVSIDGNPANEFILETQSPSAGTTIKDLRTPLGNINKLVGKTVTVSLQGINKLSSGTTEIGVYIEQNYNTSQSDTSALDVIKLVGTIADIGIIREQHTLSFTMPTLEALNFDEFTSQLYIRLRFEIGTLMHAGVTNLQLEVGDINSPLYVEQPGSLINANTLGDTVVFPSTIHTTQLGLDEFSVPVWTKERLTSYQNVGACEIRPAGLPRANQVIADGATYNVSDYSTHGIPFKRLFDVIGSDFGGAGELIANAVKNVVTVSSGGGARVLTPYESGTTTFTMTEIDIGLKLGVFATLKTATTNVIVMDFQDNFAPNQTGTNYTTTVPSEPDLTLTQLGEVIGSWWDYTLTPASAIEQPSQFVTVTTTIAGSVSTKAQAEITFNLKTFTEYNFMSSRLNLGYGGSGSKGNVYVNFLEFASVSNSARAEPFISSVAPSWGTPHLTLIPAPMHINFTMDGKIGPAIQGVTATTIVPFETAKSHEQNMRIFINAVNNPFKWTILVQGTIVGGNYFLFSSPTVDYYGWFTVDGGGVDPAVGGRTGVLIAILSGDTDAERATKIAAEIDELTFDVPDQATDLPVPVNANLDWYINI